MMCYSPMVLFEVLSVLTILAAHAVAKEVIPAMEKIDDNYIVVFKDTMRSQVNEDFIMDLINGGDRSVFRGTGDRVSHTYNAVMSGFAARLSDQGLANLQASDLVESVYEDGIVRASTEWGLDRIDQRDLPVDKSYNPSFENNGEGVTAYVIDTGILATHVDFEDRATEGENFIDDDNTDCNGHGTHVAGTIGGKTYGVAKKSNLVGLKVLNCDGAGYTSGVIAAVDWVKANHEKPAVVNMSLGSRGTNTLLATAIQNLVDAGVSVVVAAGNSNANACNYSPAGASAAITVGSTTAGDQRSYFSNYGTCVNIFAPGSGIKSTWIGGSNTATNTISGTSMASPHVCGAVALHLGDDQNLTPDQVRTKLLEDTTVGTITDIKSGSADKFLYVGETTVTPTTPSPVSSPVSRPTSRSPVSSPVSRPTSSSPVSSPVSRPTSNPSGNCSAFCYENDNARFLWKVKQGDPVYVTCEELAKMNNNKRARLCVKERRSRNGYGPASVHCRVTCSEYNDDWCQGAR